MSKALNSFHLLIKNGANVKKLNLLGESPLFLAVSHNQLDIVKELIFNYGVSPY